MPKRLEATCQYSDYRGSIAIDEPPPHPGQKDLLQEMASRANLPQGYFPVGFRQRGPRVDTNLELKRTLSITLLAVREDEAGVGLDQIKKYGEKHGSIPVYAFDLEMDIIEFCSFVQQMDVVILARGLHEHPVEVVPRA